MFPASHLFCFPQSRFVSFFLFLGDGVVYLAVFVLCLLSPLIARPLCSSPHLFSVFFYLLAVFHLCCCALFNHSWSILPPLLVPGALISLFRFFQPLFVLLSLFSYPLIPLLTKGHDKFAFQSYCIRGNNCGSRAPLEYVKWTT